MKETMNNPEMNLKEISRVNQTLDKMIAVQRLSAVYWNSESGDNFRKFLAEDVEAFRALTEKWTECVKGLQGMHLPEVDALPDDVIS